MKFFADAPTSRCVYGLAPYDEEWIDINIAPPLGEIIEHVQSLDSLDSTAAKSKIDTALSIARFLILDWSLVLADGSKLPITVESIKKLPGELLAPIFEEVGKLNMDFLARRLTPSSPDQ